MGCGDPIPPPGLVSYDAYCETMDVCECAPLYYEGCKHHFVAITFSLSELGGALGKTALSWIACFVLLFKLAKHPYLSALLGFSCSLMATYLLFEYPESFVYTFGIYDYDMEVGGGVKLCMNKIVSLDKWHAHYYDNLKVHEDNPVHLVTW